MNASRLLIIASTLTLTACASTPSVERSCFKLSDFEDHLGYCQAVRVGNTLHISGSVGSGEMAVAIPQAYATLQRTLEANGLGFEHVVKETVFTTDIEAFKANYELRKAYYDGTYPASSWIGIERLYLPEFVLEVEITAVYPE